MHLSSLVELALPFDTNADAATGFGDKTIRF